MQTIVIGHKNPDMDSICSALAYARLKQLLGVPNVVAARCGNTNARIDYVLKRYGVEAPIFLSDVAPRVADVMKHDVVSILPDSSIYDAIQLSAEHQLRGLPVVDDFNRCLGLLSMFKLSHMLFPPREEALSTRMITATLAGVTEAVGGKVVSGVRMDETGDFILMVGAMDAETFAGRLEHDEAGDIVLFVGDRENIMKCAVKAGVRAIIVTGKLAVPAAIQQAAEKAKVAIISSPYDTATTVLLSRGAVAAAPMIDTEFMSFTPETSLDAARERAANSAAPVFPVIGEDGTLAGLVSKSDFIKPVPRRLILVDHNELSQAVPGADRIPIMEILDHHRLGGMASDMPIHFWNNPVGSTSTIVAMCYQQMGVPIPREIAGLLMAGLISDTLNLSSPTATPVDRDLLDHLAKIAETDPTELAEQIFAVGSPLLTMTPEQVITADCKEYEEKGQRFTVSQIEELSFSHFGDKQTAIIEALERHCQNRGLYFAALLVTDVNTQDSLLLASGAPEFLHRITFPMQGPHVWGLTGVVSRKKQLLPYLLGCLSGSVKG